MGACYGAGASQGPGALSPSKRLPGKGPVSTESAKQASFSPYPGLHSCVGLQDASPTDSWDPRTVTSRGPLPQLPSAHSPPEGRTTQPRPTPWVARILPDPAPPKKSWPADQAQAIKPERRAEAAPFQQPLHQQAASPRAHHSAGGPHPSQSHRQLPRGLRVKPPGIWVLLATFHMPMSGGHDALGPSPHSVDGSPVVKGLRCPRAALPEPQTHTGFPSYRAAVLLSEPQNAGNRRFHGANSDAPLPELHSVKTILH
ncbi:hypothetical protein MG293_006771 [Ovis ammon polii]|uniref:Uncharacterized protein n=2 Tax=Ovis TaxID=9935 RepID=A0A836AFT7_SHEEP|nr:hypothetical protein JEQ12_017695 [Ovis aries]KAI4542645.1 hypothetical protein MG293_006771 [Ovis ammon polii]